MYVYMNRCEHAFVYICMYVRMCVCMHLYVCVHDCICVCMDLYLLICMNSCAYHIYPTPPLGQDMT